MEPDTIDEAFASLRAAFPAKVPASKPRGAAAASHGPNRRRYQPEAAARPAPIPARAVRGCLPASRSLPHRPPIVPGTIVVRSDR
jgi:hypothetical protein